MTDTLFDIDAIAPSARASDPATNSLAAGIEGAATSTTFAISNAIGRWAAAKPMEPNDTYLAQVFFDSLGAWQVQNIIPRADGDITLVLSAEPSPGGKHNRLTILNSPRYSDGLLIASNGETFIPECLVPTPFTNSETTQIRKAIDGMNLVDVIAENDYVVVVAQNRVTTARPRSHVTPVPSSLWPAGTPVVDQTVLARVRDIFHIHLRNKVAAIDLSNPTPQVVNAAIELLQETPHIHTPGSHEKTYDATTRAILEPILRHFSWEFEDPVHGLVSVKLDPWMGYSIDVTVSTTLTQLECSTTFYVHSIGAETNSAEWFRLDSRERRALAGLAAECAARRELPPEEAGTAQPTAPRRKTKIVLANADAIAAERANVETLRALLPEDLRPKATDILDRLNSPAHLSTSELDALVTQAHDVAELLLPLYTKAAQHLMAHPLWSLEAECEACALRAKLATLQSFVGFPGDVLRDFERIMDEHAFMPKVTEVSPGWWISIDRNNHLHGAVSATGFYSSSHGLDISKPLADLDPTALTARLVEPTSNWCHGSELLPSLRGWLTSLRFRPDANAVRQLQSALNAHAQRQQIAATLPQATLVLTNEMQPHDVATLRATLASHDIPHDDELRFIAELAITVLNDRFPEIVARPNTSSDDLLDLPTDLSDDDITDSPDDVADDESEEKSEDD